MEKVPDGKGVTDQSAPVSEDLSRLIEEVTDAHEGEGAAAMADQLRDQLPETQRVEESPGDLEE